MLGIAVIGVMLTALALSASYYLSNWIEKFPAGRAAQDYLCRCIGYYGVCALVIVLPAMIICLFAVPADVRPVLAAVADKGPLYYTLLYFFMVVVAGCFLGRWQAARVGANMPKRAPVTSVPSTHTGKTGDVPAATSEGAIEQRAEQVAQVVRDGKFELLPEKFQAGMAHDVVPRYEIDLVNQLLGQESKYRLHQVSEIVDASKPADSPAVTMTTRIAVEDHTAQPPQSVYEFIIVWQRGDIVMWPGV